MRNILFYSIFLLSISVLSAQEVFRLQPVDIDPENAETFEMLEEKYATPLAQEAKDKGIIKDWYLMKKVNGGRASDKISYLWIHVYEDVNQMMNAGSWWETESKFGVPSALLYDGVKRYPVGDFLYKTEKRMDSDRAGKFLILNWATPSNMNEALKLADQISDSFKSNMKKSGMAGWGMATRVYPQGSDFPPLFFWDVYETAQQALEHLMNKGVLDVVKPDMFEKLLSQLPNGFSNRVIMESITGTR